MTSPAPSAPAADVELEDPEQGDGSPRPLPRVVDKVTGEIVHLLTRDEAETLTLQIEGFLESTHSMLLKAHAGRAHKALGYETWGDYTNARFGISRGRSYQLLDLARAVAELDGLSTWVDTSTLTEREARVLKPLDPPAKVEAIEAAQQTAQDENRERTTADVAEEVANRLPDPEPDSQEKLDARAKRAAKAALEAEANAARARYIAEHPDEGARIAYTNATGPAWVLLEFDPDVLAFAVCTDALERKALAHFAAEVGKWSAAVSKVLSTKLRSVK